MNNHVSTYYRNHNSFHRCGDTKIKMKFATYYSVGFNYRSRRPTFKPQRTEEAIASDEGAITQPPQAVKLILEQKSPVSLHAQTNYLPIA